jgi:carboxylesterase type B
MIAGNTDFEAGLTLVMMGGKSGVSNLLGKTMGPTAMEGSSGCGASTAAEVRLKHNIPSWVYRFDGVYENQRISPQPVAGAYHSSDVPMTFGTTELRPGVAKDTPEQAKLSKNWRHAWAEFARDPENGLKKLGWPVYDPKRDTLVRLGFKNASEPVFASNAPYIKSCA